MKHLSAWNPLDQLRLLWWLFMQPQQLRAYWQQHGEKADLATAKWLLSTLLWLPFFLPFSAVGFGVVSFVLPSESKSTLTATHYLWYTGALFFAWFITGAFEDRDKDKLPFTKRLGEVFGMLLDLAMWDKAIDKMLEILSEILAKVLRVALAGILIGVLGKVLTINLIVGLIVGLIIGIIVGLTNVLLEGLTISLMIGLVIGLIVGLGKGLIGVLMGVTAAALTVGLAVGVIDVVQESLETGQPSWLARGVFGLLVAAYAFLVWYSYLGGWQVF